MPNLSVAANPYLESDEAITYSAVKTHDGWRIEVEFPKRVSPKDKLKVLDWLHHYRAEVRRLNPLWLASFNVLSNGYALEIRPANDLRQLAEAGEQVRKIWDETLKNA